MSIETQWACQYKTFLDGDYDRLIDRAGFGSRPLYKEEAEMHVKALNQKHQIARLVRREVSEWEPQR